MVPFELEAISTPRNSQPPTDSGLKLAQHRGGPRVDPWLERNPTRSETAPTTKPSPRQQPRPAYPHLEQLHERADPKAADPNEHEPDKPDEADEQVDSNRRT